MPQSEIHFNKPLYYIAIGLFICLAIFTPQYSFELDKQAYISWCQYIFQHGISKIHGVDPDFNYPPLICYPLWLFGKLQGSSENIARNFYLFKIFALAFDFAAALLVAGLVKGRTKQIIVFLALAANPVFIYNAYCWGQFDGVFSCLIFISFLLLLKHRLTWAVVFAVLALNFKFQAIILFPPLMLLAIYAMHKQFSVRNICSALITGLAVQLLILLPYIAYNKLPQVWHTISGAISYYTAVTHTAHNFWQLIFSSRVHDVSDNIKLGPISYKQLGLLLFCIASFFALLPLFYAWLMQVRNKKQEEIPLSRIALMFALIPLLFFFFNTQMHERYSHPAFIFIAVFSFTQRAYLPFIIMCIAYIGNIEPAVQSFHFPNYKILFFDHTFVASLYALLICILFYHLYKPTFAALK